MGIAISTEMNTLVTQNLKKKQQNICNRVTVKVRVTIPVLLFNSHMEVSSPQVAFEREKLGINILHCWNPEKWGEDEELFGKSPQFVYFSIFP